MHERPLIERTCNCTEIVDQRLTVSQPYLTATLLILHECRSEEEQVDISPRRQKQQHVQTDSRVHVYTRQMQRQNAFIKQCWCRRRGKVGEGLSQRLRRPHVRRAPVRGVVLGVRDRASRARCWTVGRAPVSHLLHVTFAGVGSEGGSSCSLSFGGPFWRFFKV